MATAFLTIHGGIINGAHHGDIGAVFCDPCHENCERVEVPFEALGNVVPGKPVEWYTPEWERRPNAELVRAGVIGLPVGHVLDGDDLRPMTEVELHEAGIKVREGMKVVDGEFVAMTPKEQLAAGQITHGQYSELAAREAESELQTQLAALMSPEAMARAELDEVYALERRERLKALLAVRDQPGWPLEARWPSWT